MLRINLDPPGSLHWFSKVRHAWLVVSVRRARQLRLTLRGEKPRHLRLIKGGRT